jgi:hypothetical protein
MSLRKVIKTRDSFPNDDAAFKLLLPSLAQCGEEVAMLVPHGSRAVQTFAIIYEGRVPTLDGNLLTQFI